MLSGVETIDSMIILLFPSPMSLSNQNIVNQNYIENEALVSAVDFRVESAHSGVSWERSIKTQPRRVAKNDVFSKLV